MRRKRLYKFRVLALLLFALAISLIAGCGKPFSSNGQRIYFTATSDSGQPITYTGGPPMMMPLACVNCHGPKGYGGRMMMFDVPNITWPELTSQTTDHPPYTEQTLKRAVTEGLDPSGNRLQFPMPQWQMSDGDLNDLVSFIKTLK